jgi:hypothetical protein
MPFYTAAVCYRFGFSCPSAAKRLRLEIGSWAGSVVTVAIDGQPVGTLRHPPYHLSCPPLAAGVHTLALTVVGNMRNLMGPHFANGLANAWTWEKCPPSTPPGRDYQFKPSGLIDTPRLVAVC